MEACRKRTFCISDSNSNDRVKVGKAILSYNPENRRIYATLVANITLGKHTTCKMFMFYQCLEFFLTKNPIFSGEDLVRGVANIYASYRGRVLYNETFDVCRDIHVKGLKCPMKKGTYLSFNSGLF